MRSIEGLTIGRTDTSIGAAIRGSSGWPATFGYALITSIDSSTNMRQLPATISISQQLETTRFLGTGLLVPMSSLVEIGERFNLFTGFDEVWFFMQVPTVSKPSTLSLVAPLDLNTEELPEGLSTWFKVSGCRLGLGDGVGMNFASADRPVAESIHLHAGTSRS